MSKKQQHQTKRFFDKIYLDWHNRAIFNKKNHFKTINERNNFVLTTLKKLKLKKHLDLGCGSGELIKESSNYSNKSVGIDFSKKMIRIAKKKYKENTKRKFYAQDIKEYFYNNSEEFDLISANGFFEYFSYPEMLNLFKNIYNNLSTNGYFIASFRNRLFNIFSLNKFSLNEIRAKNLYSLIREAVLLNNLGYKKILRKNFFYKHKLKKINQPKTGGVKVEIRNQYTPIEISKELISVGFSIQNIYPINLHLLNPKISDEKIINNLKKISLKVYTEKNLNSLLFQSSTFMILAKKTR